MYFYCISVVKKRCASNLILFNPRRKIAFFGSAGPAIVKVSGAIVEMKIHQMFRCQKEKRSRNMGLGNPFRPLSLLCSAFFLDTICPGLFEHVQYDDDEDEEK